MRNRWTTRNKLTVKYKLIFVKITTVTYLLYKKILATE